MIKKIAIVVLIVTVLAGFSVSAIRIIMRGSVRSQKTPEEIKMSEIIENATVMGTYSSDVKIKAGESIGAKDLLESALSNPVSVGSDLPYVNLSKCNIYFDSGKTKEQILSPGKKKFTIIASFEAANRDYLYYVELEADEAPATTVTKAVVSTSHVQHTTAPEKYYNNTYKNTLPATKASTKKPVVPVTTAANTLNSLPEAEITDQNPVTEPPQPDTPPDVPATPSVPDNPPEPVDPPSDQEPADPPSDPEPQVPADAQ